MSNEIIVALIAAGSSVIGTLSVTIGQRRKDSAAMAARCQERDDALREIQGELVEVKQRLDQHNGYAEKFASMTKDIALIQKDIEYLKKSA